MKSSVETFYDDLADLYHLIFEDWPRSIERQAIQLTEVIRARYPQARTIADIACGIGTQSLGLAARGFAVTGSDLSPRAIDRAKREAASRGLNIEFRVDDMERLDTYANVSVDVVIACDNALPHLLNDERMLRAMRRLHGILKPHGLFVFSVRDYATIERDPRRIVPYSVHRTDDGKTIVFQVWDFRGDLYDLNFYFVHDDGTNVSTRVFRSTYWLVTIDRLMELARDAGFVDVERLDDAFFQPLIVCRRG